MTAYPFVTFLDPDTKYENPHYKQSMVQSHLKLRHRYEKPFFNIDAVDLAFLLHD